MTQVLQHILMRRSAGQRYLPEVEHFNLRQIWRGAVPRGKIFGAHVQGFAVVAVTYPA